MSKRTITILGILGLLAMAIGIYTKVNEVFTASTAIIGQADGPTSIFIAGKVGSEFSMIVTFIGLCLLAAATILMVKKKHGGKE